jgi:hypothetical protein
MTVNIDRVEPNIFPPVEDLDAKDAGRNVEVFLNVSVEGNPTPVTVKLSYEQASDLANLLDGKRIAKRAGTALKRWPPDRD